MFNAMTDKQCVILALQRLPARLDAEQASWVLGCQKHDITVLVSTRLLKPLGNPPANGIKYFASSDILELMDDRCWLAKMTNTITQHWFKRNAAQKGHVRAGRRNGAAGSNSSAPVSNN